jgi:hypothetical protein
MRLDLLMYLAYDAHKGQSDKAKKPYILHPWRVSLNVFSKANKLRIFKGVSEEILHKAVKACVGHDLVEDTKWTTGTLFTAGLEMDVVDAIGYLSKRNGEEYFEFVERCKLNLIAHIAKICDIVDNLDIDRIPLEKRIPSDYERCAMYRVSLVQLGVEEDEMEMLLTYY